MAGDRYLFKDLAFDVKRKRPKHFENLSAAARLLKMELFPSFYKLLDDGDIRQTLFLQKFPDIEGFVELAKISKENRAVLSQGCTANDPLYLIEEKLKPEKVNSSLKFEQDPSLELVEREYVYLPIEVSSNSYPSLEYDRKWKDSFVTSGRNPMSNKFSFKVWVVESREGTQMVGLRNISNGFGHITSFNIGVPKANNHKVPELFQNACISVRELVDYLEERVPDEVWDEFLNPKLDEKEIDRESDDFFYLKRRSDNTADAILDFGNRLSNAKGRVATARELWNYIYAQAGSEEGLAYSVQFYVANSNVPQKTLTESQLKHPETCISFMEDRLHNFKAFNKRVSNATKYSRGKKANKKR